ncbi:mitochondrial ribosomal protein L37-domain-containing protein [Fimicolochytrium jonesii]|uniref:mitochondrial ribosomal protein L37-domain-containing protein n=1 Tax=Fimicolochytrium jonesii TaxID=1396493 RepID=UPI0022FDB4C9|nr:mitochondrial ribosomal protein L37-domain-containing protein [Fimicolochytrium jonesii]KAI8819046.1 mitochondrial ribosomal protein L37-domain-containing protein [Fimicolochytrium jonesii]
MHHSTTTTFRCIARTASQQQCQRNVVARCSIPSQTRAFGASVRVASPAATATSSPPSSTSDSTPTNSTSETAPYVGPLEPSSCPPGTVMKGLNIFAGKADPVALPDNEYPAWVWRLLDPPKKEWTEEEKLSMDYLRVVTKMKIKANSLAKRSK